LNFGPPDLAVDGWEAPAGKLGVAAWGAVSKNSFDKETIAAIALVWEISTYPNL